MTINFTKKRCENCKHFYRAFTGYSKTPCCAITGLETTRKKTCKKFENYQDIYPNIYFELNNGCIGLIENCTIKNYSKFFKIHKKEIIGTYILDLDNGRHYLYYKR